MTTALKVKNGLIVGVYPSELSEELNKIKARHTNALTCGKVKIQQTTIGYIFQIDMETIEVDLIPQAGDIGVPLEFGNPYYDSIEAAQNYVVSQGCEVERNQNTLSDALAFLVKQKEFKLVSDICDSLQK